MSSTQLLGTQLLGVQRRRWLRFHLGTWDIYTGRRCPSQELTVEHIVPRSKFRSAVSKWADSPWNLAVASRHTNQMRSNYRFAEFPQRLHLEGQRCTKRRLFCPSVEAGRWLVAMSVARVLDDVGRTDHPMEVTDVFEEEAVFWHWLRRKPFPEERWVYEQRESFISSLKKF